MREDEVMSGRWRRLTRVAALVLALAYGAPLVGHGIMRLTGGWRQEGLLGLALGLSYLGVVLALRARTRGASSRVGGILALLLVLASPLLIALGTVRYPSDARIWVALLGLLGHVAMAVGGIGFLTAEMRGRRRWLILGLGSAALLLGVAVASLAVALWKTSQRSPYQQATHDVRSMISGQAGWEATTGGYGVPTCLQRPTDCLPQDSGLSPTTVFLDDARAVRDGYLFTFHVTPAEEGADGLRGALRDYVVVAVPLEPAEGQRYPLCGDTTGLWTSRDGSPPRPGIGICPKDWYEWAGGGKRGDLRE